MNIGQLAFLLGIIGIIAGASMYLIDFHRTIGLGGIGLGAILVVVGAVMARTAMRKGGTTQPKV